VKQSALKKQQAWGIGVDEKHRINHAKVNDNPSARVHPKHIERKSIVSSIDVIEYRK
jgi:hypothetical protein